jgi:hypothetical protein
MTTESLAPQSRIQSELFRLSNGMDSDIIELPPITPGWKCYSKPSTNLFEEMPPSSNRIIQTWVSHCLSVFSSPDI